SAPELRLVADINVILSHEREFAIAANAEDGEAGAERLDAATFTHQKRLDAGCDHHTRAGIKGERAQLDSAAADVLDESGLTAGRMDRKHGDTILAPRENFPAVKVNRRRRPVRLIKEPAARVNMDSTRPLPGRRFWIRQRLLHEQRLAREPTPRLS